MTPEGVVLDMSEAEYHTHPAFSASKAKAILDSPARFKWEYLDGNREQRKAFDVGSAVHAKVLGTGYPVAELDFPNYRTAVAQAARDEARERGEIPMLKHEMKPINDMAESVLTHSMAWKLFEIPGAPEASVFTEHMGIPLKCRFDYLAVERPISVDLKTTSDSASPAAFARTAAKYRYHVARGHYLDVLKRATDRDAEMVFVVVETRAPHLVGVHKLAPEFADMGEAEALEARDVYKRCLDTGEWPGYPETINVLEPPVWAVCDYQDRYEREEIQV